METISLPANYENIDIPQMNYVQLNITTAGAFCILSNTATFSPPLPTGLLAIGKYPNPFQYPNGSQATGLGDCNYTFSTAKVGCDPGPTETIGKVIHVGNTMPHAQKHEHGVEK